MSALGRTAARLRTYFGEAPRVPWVWEWIALGCVILGWAWQAQGALLCALLAGVIVTWRSWWPFAPAPAVAGETGWPASLGGLLYTILLSLRFVGLTGPILCVVLAIWKPRLLVHMAYMSAAIMFLSVYSPKTENMIPFAVLFAIVRIWVRRPRGRWRARPRITWL